jgi:hypothetical protein
LSRILVHDPGVRVDGRPALLTALARHEVVRCGNREALVSALSARRPHVLVYVLDEIDRDVELLAAIREAAPRLPIILLGEPATLEARRLIQALRPTYFGVFPLEGGELEDAVNATLDSGAPAR